MVGFWLHGPPLVVDLLGVCGPGDWAGVECGKGKECRLPDAEAAAPMALTAPAEGALLTERKVSFKWEAVPGAVGYELTVTPESGDGAAPGLVRKTAEPGYCCFEVPEGGALPRHAYFRWTADALSSTGRRMSTGEGTFVLKRAE